ncbi:MAG: epimerase, partial [Candidatus Heimdallarchaeota archaeon]|nr:epimerase [Candidatus Heimdallarchaeota archaeon]
EAAPIDQLSQLSYNVTSFSPSAAKIRDLVLSAFPSAEISYEVNKNRQSIVDSWPEDIEDSSAKKDWKWQADFDMKRSFNEYLIPAIRNRYESA